MRNSCHAPIDPYQRMTPSSERTERVPQKAAERLRTGRERVRHARTYPTNPSRASNRYSGSKANAPRSPDGSVSPDGSCRGTPTARLMRRRSVLSRSRGERSACRVSILEASDVTRGRRREHDGSTARRPARNHHARRADAPDEVRVRHAVRRRRRVRATGLTGAGSVLAVTLPGGPAANGRWTWGGRRDDSVIHVGIGAGESDVAITDGRYDDRPGGGPPNRFPGPGS